MFFERLKKFLKAFIAIDLNRLVFEISNTDEFRKMVIRLNTEEQLFKKGINSEGIRLDVIGGGYSAFTKERKIFLDQPIDRITLKDTGEFYDSFYIDVFVGGFIINADPFKDGTNLLVEWGSDIIGLTTESKRKISLFYKEKILIKLNSLL